MEAFKYCLNTSTIQPASLPDKIRAAGEAGYDAIELWHADVDAYVAEGHTVADVRHMLDDRGLTVPSMIFIKGWFDMTAETRPAVLAEARRRLEQAAELGSKICVSGPLLGPVDLLQGANNFRALLELGREIGVRPSLEFLGFAEMFNSVEIALQLLANINEPDASVVVDPFHLFRGGAEMSSVAACGIAGVEIGILHFNDTPAEPPREQQHDLNRVMPGDGHLDLATYLQQARLAGYQGPLSLELFNREYWQRDPLDVAREGLEKMKAVVERA